MTRKMLYKVPREGGGYTVSLNRPPDDQTYNIRWRLIADEGKAITDGNTIVTVIDVLHRSDCDAWSDCAPPASEPSPEELATMFEPSPFGKEPGNFTTGADTIDSAAGEADVVESEVITT